MEEEKPGEGTGEKKEEPKAEVKKGENKAEESKEPPPPPPQEIVLRLYMHCEGCAKKVRKCLKGLDGVEDVLTDCKTQKVVVKGEKADPLKVQERLQRKSHRQVELLSPIPTPPAEEPKKAEEKEVAKPEEKKEEVISVVLKVHMHCEACAQEIKRRILKMKGVENVEADLKSSEVTVKGVFEPPKLVDYVYKRTGKHGLIVKQEAEKKEEEKPKEEKKADDGGDKEAKQGGEEVKEKMEGEGEEATPPPPVEAAAAAEGGEEAAEVVEAKKNEVLYNFPQNNHIYPYPPRHELYAYQYPPQIFSDENPNACSVM